MVSTTMPFQGTLWFWEESTYGGGESGTTHPISCKILDARPGINDKHKKLLGIDSPCACTLFELATDVVFHLEYIPQCDDVLMDYIIDRTSTGSLRSLAFCLGTNTRQTAAADKTYFDLVGCKAKTVSVAASFNDTYVVTVDFSVKSGTSDTSPTGSAPGALTGDFLGFHHAGAISKDGSSFAYITDAIDITFNHNTTDYWDHDSLVKQLCVEGERSIEGTIDISLDEGGKVEWGEIYTQTEFDVIVDLGGTGCPRLTLPNAKWKSGEFDVNRSNELMKDSMPFTSHCSNFSECSNVVSSTP